MSFSEASCTWSGRIMKTLPSVFTIAVAAGVIGGISSGAVAAPITYDFTGTVAGNQALGASHTYTAAGAPNITAISGSYTQSGSGAPIAGDVFSSGGQLVGNNRGADEMGVGVCFGNGCNRDDINDDPEIDASGREVVRLDITPPLVRSSRMAPARAAMFPLRRPATSCSSLPTTPRRAKQMCFCIH